jgi:Domain of unknown function (DUF4332)
MAIVLSLLRTAHARGTHHALALDALTELRGSSAPAWERLFYHQISLYLDGAKAPDRAFKDFQNHVLHPRHNYWGGATQQAQTWYGELVAALTRQDWPVAAYAAGVLSHYCTDPLMPLHTHQTAAENNIHAALEWTVAKSYTNLRAMGLEQFGSIRLIASEEADWLPVLLRAGAARATAHYETLLAHYDFKRGVVAPEEGLDPVGQRAIAEMLIHASRLFALVLDRAVADAGTTPPEVSLASDALRAFASKPRTWWRNRSADASDRKLIEAMYDELMQTGAIVRTLPDDEKLIRDLFAEQVLAKPTEAATPKSNVITIPNRATEKAIEAAPVRVAAPDTVSDAKTTAGEDPRADAIEAADIAAAAVPQVRVQVPEPRPAPQRIDAPAVRRHQDVEGPLGDVRTAVAETHAEREVPATAAAGTEVAAFAGIDLANIPVMPVASVPVPVAAAPAPTIAASVPATSLSAYRPSSSRTPVPQALQHDADVVDAPSIGPKIALKLNAVGIDTVGDFLNAHPIALASRLQSSVMTPEVLAEWQDQTRLMCELPDLRATQAKLLVGAGYKSVDTVAAAEPDQLCADILRYALTPEGQRLLRDGHAPDVEQIRAWADNARAIKAA